MGLLEDALSNTILEVVGLNNVDKIERLVVTTLDAVTAVWHAGI